MNDGNNPPGRAGAWKGPSALEPSRPAVDERTLSEDSRIIPGDWGKVRPGWLAGPLGSRAERRGGGGRIHQPLWRCSHTVSDAKQGLGGQER
jgi:hypothetical protein